MKNVLILIALVVLVAFTGNAKAQTKKIMGELVNEGETIAVYTLEGRVVVHSDSLVNDCFSGEYEIVEESKGEALFKLVDTIFCRGKSQDLFNAYGSEKSASLEKSFCPMVYAPVCGIINGVPQTFGNTCELNNAKARKLFLGACDKVLSGGIKGHQDLNAFELTIQ